MSMRKEEDVLALNSRKPIKRSRYYSYMKFDRSLLKLQNDLVQGRIHLDEFLSSSCRAVEEETHCLFHPEVEDDIAKPGIYEVMSETDQDDEESVKRSRHDDNFEISESPVRYHDNEDEESITVNLLDPGEDVELTFLNDEEGFSSLETMISDHNEKLEFIAHIKTEHNYNASLGSITRSE